MPESTEKQTVVERASGLSDEILGSVDAGRHAAIEAVRKFVSTLKEATPALVDASQRNSVIDGGLDLADELSTALTELLRSITRSTSETLGSKQTVVERASGLSDEILESVDAGRRAAIEAVRKFVSTLKEAIPALVDASQRNSVIDGGLDLADELSTALTELLRSITRSTSETLSGKPGGTKE